MSKVAPPVPPDREGVLFAGRPSLRSLYIEALTTLIDRANVELSRQHLATIPKPPGQLTHIPESESRRDSA